MHGGRANPLVDGKGGRSSASGVVAMAAVATLLTTAGCSVVSGSCNCSCNVVVNSVAQLQW